MPPSAFSRRNLLPQAIALVLAAGTAVRLVAGSAAGCLADRLDAPKAIFCVCAAAAALIALGYLPARSLWLLLLVGVLHSAALAPLAPLSDTFALGTAAPTALALARLPDRRLKKRLARSAVQVPGLPRCTYSNFRNRKFARLSAGGEWIRTSSTRKR